MSLARTIFSRIAQKVERFYKNIVEESLFGKDPDVAEDMTDPKTSTEAISRRRQRNEICTTLKRGSLMYRVYIGKNLFEVLLVLVFLPVNVAYALFGSEGMAPCSIKIQAFAGLVDDPGEVLFQCRGKPPLRTSGAVKVEHTKRIGSTRGPHFV